MKQLAVDWLYDQMNNIKGSSISMNGSVQFIEKELNNLFKQAKAMEKEQIKDAWFDGVTNWDSEKEVEDYINETFKSE